MRHGAIREHLVAAAQYNSHRKDAHRFDKVVGQQCVHEFGAALGY
jgi:hypothetical protein